MLLIVTNTAQNTLATTITIRGVALLQIIYTIDNTFTAERSATITFTMVAITAINVHALNTNI